MERERVGSDLPAPALPAAAEGPTPPSALTAEARAAAQGAVALLVLQTLVRVVALAAVVLVTRHLSPDEFGRYSSVAAVVLFCGFLADFGTSPAITRLVSRSPQDADGLLSGTLLASLLLGLLAYAGALVFAWLFYSGAAVVDVAIGAMAVPAASMGSSLLGALDGKGMTTRRAVVTALQGVLVAAGMVPVFFGAGVRAPIVALAAAPWCGLALAGGMARRAGVWRMRLFLDVSRTKALLRLALPFAVSGGLTALTVRFDVILLSVVGSRAETASYDLAVRLVEASTYIATALLGPLLFIFTRRIGAGDTEGAGRVYREAVRLVYLLGIPVSVTLAVLAGPLVRVVFGAGFRSVETPLALLGVGLWLSFVMCVQGALVMAGRALGLGIAVGGVIAAVTVVLDLLLVPGLGPRGAALATLAAWTFGVLAQHRFHRRIHGISTPLPTLRLLVAALGLGAVLLLLHDAPVAVPLVAGAATYLFLLVVTREVGGADVRRLLALLPGSRA